MSAIEDELQRLRVNTLFEKRKHFNAAARIAHVHHRLQLIALLTSAGGTGSALLGALRDAEPQAATLVAAGLSFVAATVAGILRIQTPQDAITGHTILGNKYVALAQDCAHVKALTADGLLGAEGLAVEVRQLLRRYQELNEGAASYPTSETDYRAAQRGVIDGEESYTELEMGL